MSDGVKMSYSAPSKMASEMDCSKYESNLLCEYFSSEKFNGQNIFKRG